MKRISKWHERGKKELLALFRKTRENSLKKNKCCIARGGWAGNENEYVI